MFMKILLDTNIFIALEPTTTKEAQAEQMAATNLMRLAQAIHADAFLHPIILDDIKRDTNQERQKLHLRAFQKYRILPSPPDIDRLPKEATETIPRESNDWVDCHLLAALQGNACDFLVTEDLGIHARAKRFGLESRVLHLHDALDFLATLANQPVQTKPNVRFVHFHEIDHQTPFFDSLREDYPEFDDWFAQSARKHRQAFAIYKNNDLAGIAAIKDESSLPDGTNGKVLKLCTLKISALHIGLRYGELLLNSVCEYCHNLYYEYIYLTVFPKYETLLNFLEAFGFIRAKDKTSRGEYVYIKRLICSEQEKKDLAAHEFYRLFSPYSITFEHNQSYIVPIRIVQKANVGYFIPSCTRHQSHFFRYVAETQRNISSPTIYYANQRRILIMVAPAYSKVVVLSLHPVHADAILDGKKTVEFRRSRIPPDATDVIIYATSPIQKVLGRAKVVNYHEAAPSTIWRKHKSGGNVKKAFYDSYFSNAEQARCYVLSSPIRFNRGLPLKTFGLSSPPQSFAYAQR